MKTIIDPNIQIGDIRICQYTGSSLVAGTPVEIIKQHLDNYYWHVKIVETDEIWIAPNEDFENSALYHDLLQELVIRGDEEYEVCE